MIAALLLPPLLASCLRHIRGDQRTSTTEAISIASLPVLYFFSFLFYTDVCSALLVLLSLRLALVNRHWASAIVRPAETAALTTQVGLLSLSFR